MEENPYAPPRAAVADAIPAHADEVLFFPVSIWKLVVLSVCTLGLYQVYWFYKNWAIIKRRAEPDIIPVLRVIFAVFFCYPLFRAVREEEERRLRDKALAAIPIAVIWIGLQLSARLPEPYGWLVLLSPFPLIPVQIHINRLNDQLAPGHDPNSRFTLWNWIAILVGFTVISLMIYGVSLAGTATRLDSP